MVFEAWFEGKDLRPLFIKPNDLIWLNCLPGRIRSVCFLMNLVLIRSVMDDAIPPINSAARPCSQLTYINVIAIIITGKSHKYGSDTIIINRSRRGVLPSEAILNVRVFSKSEIGTLIMLQKCVPKPQIATILFK